LKGWETKKKSTKHGGLIAGEGEEVGLRQKMIIVEEKVKNLIYFLFMLNDSLICIGGGAQEKQTNIE
jgi:hypothetical protein